MTARRSSWLRRLALGVAAVVALLVAAVAAVPLFVDGDLVRHAVERRISDVAGGEVSYDSLTLRFFPQPRAEIRNATVRIPGAVAGRIGTLEIRIALLPLLAGNVRPVAVNVGQPVLELTIQPGGGGDNPLDAYRTALGPVVDALVRHARGMSLGITDGKLDVLHAGRRILSLSGLAARRAGGGGRDPRRRERLGRSLAHGQPPAEDRAGLARGDEQAAGERPAPRGGAAGGRSPERGARARGGDRRHPRRRNRRSRERAGGADGDGARNDARARRAHARARGSARRARRPP